MHTAMSNNICVLRKGPAHSESAPLKSQHLSGERNNHLRIWKGDQLRSYFDSCSLRGR